MTITFDSDNDIIVYALEKVIAYASNTQQIFVAQYVLWLVSVVGLVSELIMHIDNLKISAEKSDQNTRTFDPCTHKDDYDSKRQEEPVVEHGIGQVHPDGIGQVSSIRDVSSTPRDLAKDQRSGDILERDEHFLEESTRDRNHWQWNRVDPLPLTRSQFERIGRRRRRSLED